MRDRERNNFRPPRTIAAMKLEEYGIIGDLHTAALVGSDGSIDWLCLPHFDSGACFAALLGNERHGHWKIAPSEKGFQARQRYRHGTLILETEFFSPKGAIRVIDFMPPGDERHNVMRIVEGVSGSVCLSMDLIVRFDYGRTVPWVTQKEGRTHAVAGPNAVALWTNVETYGHDLSTRADFEVSAGQRALFVLTWYSSHQYAPKHLDPVQSLEETEKYWTKWSAQCTYQGPWKEAVVRSLITLKALTFDPTGGILAAITTSVPEFIGGVRNWDYRFCWLRDATFTLYAMMGAGFTEEAVQWSEWLLRAIAGDPSQLQIMYGASGERLLPEIELSHLPGYEDSRPVRIGNAAAEQFQLDVYGEIIDANHLKRKLGLKTSEDSWRVERHLIRFVLENWRRPDEGLWEIRGPRRHFTHSKLMAWVALDRAVKAVDQFELEGDGPGWRAARDEIHADICAHGYHVPRGAFTQYYGSDQLDASLLMMPLVGFLPIDDPRIAQTIAAIKTELLVDGLVQRYSPGGSEQVDGLPPGEGRFLPCSFWLVDCLFLQGKQKEACELFERLLRLRTPLGLLSEEYDPQRRRLVGNFPQAFSHVGLINSAQNLAHSLRPASKPRGE